MKIVISAKDRVVSSAANCLWRLVGMVVERARSVAHEPGELPTFSNWTAE